MQPKVSIVIPVYNCENYIRTCMESITNQTYRNIEVIIINDGSKDKTKDIINSFISKDSRIIYIEQENSGPSMARNNGIDKATGEYLIFIDSDDTVEENYVEILLKSILDEKNDIVCCGYSDISIYGNVNCSDFIYDTNNIKKQDFLYKVCQGTGGVLWSKIFKKEIIDNYNVRMNKDIFMCEDLIFVLQYGSYCNNFSYIDEYLYNYNRLNVNSISSNISKEYLYNYIDVCKHIESILLDNNLKKEEVSKIISNRVQSIVTTIIDSEIKNINKKGIKEIFNDINDIISEEYINLYKTSFKADSKLSKPYVFLIKNNKIYECILYRYILSLLRNFKQTIKLNKKVQMEN